jgi:hypothetical protein
MTPSPTSTRGDNTSCVARGYSYAEWQSLKNNQRQQVYQERECQNHSMAAINISTMNNVSASNSFPQDSGNTASSVYAGQIRGVEQASLDNVIQATS